MAAHLLTSERAQRGAALLVALGIGLVTLAITDNDGEQALPGTTTTSTPRVLGAVVTAPPDAAPAEPVPVEVPDADTTEPTTSVASVRPSAAAPVRRPATSTTAPVTTSTTTSPSTDPTLIPPTVIENTTTTEATTTTEGTTTTETTETTAVP